MFKHNITSPFIISFPVFITYLSYPSLFSGYIKANYLLPDTPASEAVGFSLEII